MFGDAPESLRAELASHFPKATVQAGDAEFQHWVEQLVTHIEAPSHALDLPFDIQGTAFQRKVWEALRAIPAGATASYAEIARQIGQPKAVRQSLAPVRRTRWRSLSPVIALFAPMAALAAIAGASGGSGNCSTARRDRAIPPGSGTREEDSSDRHEYHFWQPCSLKEAYHLSV